MSDTERQLSSRSPCAREAKTRKFADFNVTSEDPKLNRSSGSIYTLFSDYVTFDGIAATFASISLLCSYFLVLIPAIFSVFFRRQPSSIFSNSVLMPFLSVYKSYCTLTLDPFVCKVQPGWMYAPLLVEICIQVPTLKTYLYFFKHPGRLSIQQKKRGFISYGLVVLIKTLPILCEVMFNPTIENKMSLFLVYGTDVLASCSLAMASVYKQNVVSKAPMN